MRAWMPNNGLTIGALLVLKFLVLGGVPKIRGI
jgi:hypothetical protein